MYKEVLAHVEDKKGTITKQYMWTMETMLVYWAKWHCTRSCTLTENCFFRWCWYSDCSQASSYHGTTFPPYGGKWHFLLPSYLYNHVPSRQIKISYSLKNASKLLDQNHDEKSCSNIFSNLCNNCIKQCWQAGKL